MNFKLPKNKRANVVTLENGKSLSLILQKEGKRCFYKKKNEKSKGLFAINIQREKANHLGYLMDSRAQNN